MNHLAKQVVKTILLQFLDFLFSFQWVSTIDVGGSAPNSHLWVSILVVLFNKLKKCTL